MILVVVLLLFSLSYVTAAGNSTNSTLNNSTTSNSTIPANTTLNNSTTSNSTTPANTTSTSGTTTPVTTGFPTVCVPAAPSKSCTFGNSLLKPLGYPDPDDYFASYRTQLCDSCKKGFTAQFLCGFVLAAYDQFCPNNKSLVKATPSCLSDCLTAKSKCPILICDPNTLFDFTINTPCQRNGGHTDICTGPDFLDRYSGGVPNWAWIFCIGLGTLIIIIIIIAVILYNIPRAWFDEYLNPCRWCTFCPYYYDV